MNYATQREAARKGIITRQMREAIQEEKISEQAFMEGMVRGSIVVPANKNHLALKAKGIGTGLTTKINVNIGVSQACCNYELELEKVKRAVDLHADSVMDLSLNPDSRKFRKLALSSCSVMFGTVPVYDAAIRRDSVVGDLTVDDLFGAVREHAEDGVDFLTIHAGLTSVAVERLKRNMRLTHVVSRGGSILLDWMEQKGRENPFYEHFDRLLDICREFDVTLSLGDGLRPGSLHDATDAPQIQELIFLGELTKRAWEADVQVMIEGPGHVPIHEIAANMQLEKKLCHGAPFYVLGPLVTDVAPGYDHITSAIGGAIAGAAGADFLCYVTPAEHLRLPDVADVKEGIIASRIAAHAADIAKGIPGALDWDHKMSEARKNLDWEGMFSLAMDPEKARAYRASSPVEGDVCSMCGDLCAVKRSRKVLEK
ncbi:MAG: phosphomethylpyrimidine synthase ThiC [Spirochaetes bacterium]|nr:MAG: phosphomethylpyrimidine synthase ThiC [Spirochaetota bacterium]